MDVLTQRLLDAIEDAIRHGESQHSLAIRAGMSPIALSRFRRRQPGRDSLSLNTAGRLAYVLGLELAPISLAKRSQKPNRTPNGISLENEIQKRAL